MDSAKKGRLNWQTSQGMAFVLWKTLNLPDPDA